MKTLKTLNSLTLAASFLAAAFFCACSETKNPQDAGVWEDEPAIADNESSSSSLLEIESSSSVVKESSSSVKVESSSSSIAGIHIPDNQGCAPDPLDYTDTQKPLPAAKKPAKMAEIKADSAKEPSYAAIMMKEEEYGVLSAFVEKRLEFLEKQGAAHDSAWIQAATELLRELGLDSLLADRRMPTYYLEYTLFFLYGDGHNQLNAELVNDFADGKLEPENYCINNQPYDSFDRIAFNFMPLGCAYSDYEILDPEAIVQNIWRKCSGMPYCSDAMVGMFNKDSSLICKKSSYYNFSTISAYYTNWEIASPLDVETSGIPCDVDGKFIVSRKNPERSYVCTTDNGWDSTKTVNVEMKQVPCDTAGTLFKSNLNPGAVYICRDTVWTGKYFIDREYTLNAWDMATPFEAEVVDVPCEKNGEMTKSVVKPDSFHICRNGVWGTATRLERETYGTPCDEEGKRVESRELQSMYYVCHEGEWRQFDEVTCENGARYSTANEKYKNYKTNYACKDGKWYSSNDESWEIPYELYFNPDIEYGSFLDPRDGRTYRTIDYRGTTWMAENLKYQGAPGTFEVDKQFCESDNCKNSGYFYTIKAAEQACPEGWRLPNSNEVSLLRIPDGSEESGEIEIYTSTRDLFNTLFTQMNSLGVGYNGLDTYGLSFTKTGLFNRDAHVNSDYQYFWFLDTEEDRFWLHDTGESEISLAEITTYEIELSNRFYSVRNDIKAPVRCVKE